MPSAKAPELKIVQVKIGDLIASEYNPRKISPHDLEQLKASLKRFGFVDPLVVNSHPKRKNIIIGGHKRLIAAQENGATAKDTVPCVYLKLTEARERELNIRLNRNTGEWDWDILSKEFEVDDLHEFGFSETELMVNYDVGDGGWDGDDDDYGGGGGGGDGAELNLVGFEFGDIRGRASREVYDQFRDLYNAIKGDSAMMLEDILAEIVGRGK